MSLTKQLVLNIIRIYGGDILDSVGIQSEKDFIQHGDVTLFAHSVGVAYTGVLIALTLHIDADLKSIVRGALLHDYFQYDWHVPDKSHRLHGFYHANLALENAKRDFELNSIECDIIRKHMFPLNIRPPKYKESYIVCLSDKICATGEMIGKTNIPKEFLKRNSFEI